MTNQAIETPSNPLLGATQDIHHINVARLKCLLKCVLSLNEEEAQVLSYLIVQGRGAIAKDIAAALHRNPEVVRRALRSLYARSLVHRRPYPLRRGGRAYMYEVPEPLIRTLIGVCNKMDELIKAVGGNGGRRTAYNY